MEMTGVLEKHDTWGKSKHQRCFTLEQRGLKQGLIDFQIHKGSFSIGR